jgi:AAA domain
MTASYLPDIDIPFPKPKTEWIPPEVFRLGDPTRPTDSGTADGDAGHNGDSDSSKVVPLRQAREPRMLVSRSLAEVEMRSIEWLDKPLWQRAAFHLVAGKKGAGKGTCLADLSSRVTNGELFDKPMNVLLLSSEDSDSIDIKPRVVAAGGDVNRIHTINDRVILPDDVDALKQHALGIGEVGLFAIDPIGNHLGGINTDAEGPVRTAIAPLNDLADELDCLLIGVRHLKKDTQAGALASVLGSTAWVDVPRSVIVMAADDEEEMLFHIEARAGNRGPSGQGRAFRIELVAVEGLSEPVTRAVEIGNSGKSVENLLGGKRESKSGRARELLLELLDGVPQMESDALDAQVAREANCSARTVRNLRMAMNKEGLLRSFPERDESGNVACWYVARTNATTDAAA